MVTTDAAYAARNTLEAAQDEPLVRIGETASVPLILVGTSARNPRTQFDETQMEALAESLRQYGMLEPLVVRLRATEGPAARTGKSAPTYEIVAGERRWRAAQRAGLTQVPIRVIRALDDAVMLRLALTENLVREDLDPLEEARGYRRLQQEAGLTQAEIGAAVGKSQPQVAKRLALLDLPEDVQERIQDGRLSAAHGVALARWKQWPAYVSWLAGKVITDELTSKSLEGKHMPQFDLPLDVGRNLYHGLPWDVRTVCAAACPHGAYAQQGSLCLYPAHFDELMEQSRDASRVTLEAARAEAERGGDAGTALPRIADLAEGTYRRVDYLRPEGCSDACPCQVLALDALERRIAVCSDPARYDGLMEAEAQARQQRKRERLTEQIQRMQAALTTMVGPADGLRRAKWDEALAVLAAAALAGRVSTDAIQAAELASGVSLPDLPADRWSPTADREQALALAERSEGDVVAWALSVVCLDEAVRGATRLAWLETLEHVLGLEAGS